MYKTNKETIKKKKKKKKGWIVTDNEIHKCHTKMV